MTVLWILLLLAGLGVPFTAHAADEPLAVVDGVAIGSEEVEKSLAGQLTKLEEQIYNLKRQRVEAMVKRRAVSSVFCLT
jgi:hypothetical protein